MRRRVGLVLLSLVLGNVQAHETQSAGPVAVTFATGAEDVLSSSGPTTLLFTLRKKDQPLASCRCRVLIYAGTPSARVAPIVDQWLPALGEGGARLQIGAMASGSYTVVLDGRPTTFGDFDAFRLRYVVTTR